MMAGALAALAVVWRPYESQPLVDDGSLEDAAAVSPRITSSAEVKVVVLDVPEGPPVA